MPRLSLWNQTKKNNYKFMDRNIKEQYYVGGTALLVHKYIGVEGGEDETSIQDVLFLENRDRKYDDDVYELRGIYNVNDNDFDFGQWGGMLSSDIIFLSVHTNDTIDKLGRKIMSGDVIELPHLRDENLLDDEAGAINKYFKVNDVTREAGGYSQTWYSHTLRLKCSPLENSQEYLDIVGREEDGSDSEYDILSTYQNELDINNQWYDKAVQNTPHRNFATQQFWVVPYIEHIHGEKGTQNPWIFAGEGEGVNGAQPIETGKKFPDSPVNGDYFLHTAYNPKVLFKRYNDKWIRVEYDFQEDWSPASRILETFINNDNITDFGTETQTERQGLSQVMTRRDVDYGREDWNS